MQKALGYIAVLGLFLIMYNEYKNIPKEVKQVKVKK